MLKENYETVEEAYNELFKPLVRYAEKHTYSRDRAVDAVQDAFVKVLEYKEKKPEAKINRFILYRETIRACRRINKTNKEVLMDEEALEANEKEDIRKQRGKAEPRFTEY